MISCPDRLKLLLDLVESFARFWLFSCVLSVCSVYINESVPRDEGGGHGDGVQEARLLCQGLVWRGGEGRRFLALVRQKLIHVEQF